MDALFGSGWAAFLLPTMPGFAVLLIVLALKPSRYVAWGATAFAVVCVLIGIGQLVDQRRTAERFAEYQRCAKGAAGDAKAIMERCSPLLGDGVKMGFVGNEAYAN